MASASNDRWADPLGEYQSAYLGNAAYELHGKKGLPGPNPPEVGNSIGESIGYHLREGAHEL